VSRRLDQRFGLLAGGSRAALPRHRTLRSLIDWSYDLLSDAEKALLNRMSVFAGGCTLEAAENVCTGEGINATAVLDLLASLVDKSLIVADERDGATRYGLLETVRHYARDQLRDSGEEEQTHGRHLRCFAALAEDGEARLRGPEQVEWLDRLAMEHDNVRAALTRSAADGGDVVSGLRLAGAFFPFWLRRGYFGEGRRWISELLAVAPRGPAGGATRAKALHAAGVLAWRQSDHTDAYTHLKESLEISRVLGDRRGYANALHSLALVDADRCDYVTARAALEEALRIYRELGDRWDIANALSSLGNVARRQGDYPAAQSLCEEALALHRMLDEPFGIAFALTGLAIIANRRHDYPVARARYEEALPIFRRLGDRLGIATTLAGIGTVAGLQGDLAAAKTLLKEALVIQRELGDRNGIALSLEALAAACATASPDRAARMWGAASQWREESGTAMPPARKSDYDRQVAVARAALSDDAAFDLAWGEGRAMTLENALRYALDAEDAALVG
jgi:non-specific serine/threonine protein kinase